MYDSVWVTVRGYGALRGCVTGICYGTLRLCVTVRYGMKTLQCTLAFIKLFT